MTNRLHRKLGPFGVLLLTLSCLSPIQSVYGIGTDVLLHAGTGAAAMFLLGIGVAVVWAVIYAELGSAYPYAGGDYTGVGTILGPSAAFASLTIWSVTGGPAIALLARTIATYATAAVPGWSPDLVAFVALAAGHALALLTVRLSALVTGIFLALEMLAAVALVAAGLLHPARSLVDVLHHPLTLGVDGALVPAAVGAMALAGVSAAYATTGGNQAIAFGEELVDPHRHMGRVIIVAAMLGALATALPVIAIVLGTGDVAAALRSPAPIDAFFRAIAGRGAGLALNACVIVAVFNALIAQIMFTARLFYSLGRDEIFPRPVNAVLAGVHGATGVPRGATWAASLFGAACCLLSMHTLVVFLSGLTVYSLALVSSAVLVGRRRGLTGEPGYWRAPLHPLAPLLGLALAAVFAVAALLDEDAGRPSLVLMGLMIAAGLWWCRALQRRRPGWAPRLG